MTQPPSDQNPYGAPPPPQEPYGAPGGYGAAPQPHPKGTLVLILGILSIFCCGIFTGIPAIIIGGKAKKDIDANPGAYTNGGMVKAGWILGIISIALTVLWIILYATGVLTVSGSASTN